MLSEGTPLSGQFERSGGAVAEDLEPSPAGVKKWRVSKLRLLLYVRVPPFSLSSRRGTDGGRDSGCRRGEGRATGRGPERERVRAGPRWGPWAVGSVEPGEGPDLVQWPVRSGRGALSSGGWCAACAAWPVHRCSTEQGRALHTALVRSSTDLACRRGLLPTYILGPPHG